MTSFRVGLGHDVHRFSAPEEGRRLVLGGVPVAGARGLSGHSDADVVVHAVCDAVLGALGLGDLGTHFPDTDPRWKGASSLAFLQAAASMMAERGYGIVNLDVVVVAEEPRIAPHVEAMRSTMASILGAGPDAINVKGTRPEGLGSLGRREGIACHAVVLLGPKAPAPGGPPRGR